MNASLYPLLTERRIVSPLWGGTRLRPWLQLADSAPERIGESWQVYDENRICNGQMAGITLAEATQRHGAALIGTRAFAQYGADFPLLAKFIDAAQPLSIQVHPDDAYAHTHEQESGFHGKTEAWYILHAEPGAAVLYGLTEPLSTTAFRDAVTLGEAEALFRRLPVRQGDVVFVPAGTLHAIDGGITLFEIQQKSDLTYRVYDYGRLDVQTGKPRELHLEKAIAVSTLEPAERDLIPPLRLDEVRELLVACSRFAMERWNLTTPLERNTDEGTFELLTVLSGEMQLEWNGGVIPLAQGESAVLPAILGRFRLTSSTMQAVEGLRVHVPDLDTEYVQPLLERGLPRAHIYGTVVP